MKITAIETGDKLFITGFDNIESIVYVASSPWDYAGSFFRVNCTTPGDSDYAKSYWVPIASVTQIDTLSSAQD